MCLARALLFPAYSFKFFVLFFQLNSFFIQDIIDWFFLFYPIDQQMVFTNKWQISGFFIFFLLFELFLYLCRIILNIYSVSPQRPTDGPPTYGVISGLFIFLVISYLRQCLLMEVSLFYSETTDFLVRQQMTLCSWCLDFIWWKIHRRSSLDSLCFIYLGFFGCLTKTTVVFHLFHDTPRASLLFSFQQLETCLVL